MEQAGVWYAAGAIPELQGTIEAADREAAAIYESHMTNVREGDVATVPLDSDSVSAADRTLEAERRYGRDSEQYRDNYQGLVVNCQRYLAETWSKLGPEYFPKLRQTYDAERRDYLSFGVPITPMIHRGITPLAESEEVPRRFMENRENAVNNRLGQLVMRAAGVSLLDAETGAETPAVALPSELRGTIVSSQTISGCPEHIIARYERDRELGVKRQYSGYAPQIRKRMLRSTSYDPRTGDRYVEQLSVAGDYINEDIVWQYLELRGVIAEGEKPDVTEVLGLQMLTDNTEGVLGMIRPLDALASQASGKRIFMGEEVADDHPMDYEAFPAQAEARQQRQMAYAEELAEYSLQLAASGVDHAIANKMIDDMVERQMLSVAKEDIEMARIALDDETADVLQEAKTARSRGDWEMAAELERRAEEIAPPPEGCSGGACEVKDVGRDSDEGREIARLTRAKAGDKLAVDESKARRCKCGGQIAYAYTDDKVNKVCLKCQSFESKSSIIKKSE